MVVPALFILSAYLASLSDGKLRKGPICSSKGKKYTNMCAFLEDTCRPNDREYDDIVIMKKMRLCKGKRDVIFSKKKSIVCVINGNKIETKQRCELMKESCQGNEIQRQILHSGTCGNCTEPNLCRWDIRRKATGRSPLTKRRLRRSFMICADDGTSYSSVCKFSIAKCERYKQDKTILKLAKKVKSTHGGRHLETKCIPKQGTNEPEDTKKGNSKKH